MSDELIAERHRLEGLVDHIQSVLWSLDKCEQYWVTEDCPFDELAEILLGVKGWAETRLLLTALHELQETD